MKHLSARIVAALLAMMLFGASALSAGAQEASPVVGAANCTGEQANVDELLALWYPADGAATPAAVNDLATMTEITIPIGSAADEATVAAVEATVREVFACFEAGEVLRAYALFTGARARIARRGNHAGCRH
jgi:hypothetical protein